MEQIRKHFEALAKLNDREWDFFSSKLKRQEIDKKEILLNAGQTEGWLSFIETGIIRLYIPREENELTFAFAFGGAFVSGYDSFLTRLPSTYTLQALKTTVLWRIGYDDLQSVYAETGVGNAIGRRASEELFLKKSQRELSLLNQTAEQRYLDLFSRQPKLIREIPLKYIASYIGITPQALSRIRRRIIK